jgi:hypothetical protein
MVAALATVDLLKERRALGSENSLHQHTAGGRPLVELRANDDVVGAAPHDLLAFCLLLKFPMLEDLCNDVEAPVVFDLSHKDVATTLRRRVTG